MAVAVAKEVIRTGVASPDLDVAWIKDRIKNILREEI